MTYKRTDNREEILNDLKLNAVTQYNKLFNEISSKNLDILIHQQETIDRIKKISIVKKDNFMTYLNKE